MLAAYIADVTELENPERFARLYSAASPRRRAKTDALRFPKDKRLSLGAEALLRYACGQWGTDYARAQLAEGKWGKPYFTNAALMFNLSHSGSKVMCAVSDKPVGCDTEQIAAPRLEIAKRFFTPAEYRLCLAREDMFYRLWTAKESYIKYTGRGLSLALDRFEVTLEGDRLHVIGSPCTVLEHDLNDGYRYAVCGESDECIFMQIDTEVL